MKLNDRHKRYLTITLLLFCFAGILYLSANDDIAAYLAHIINEKTKPTVFILLFILLPMVGFPIIFFLILLGIKFGTKFGILLMFLCLPLHLASSFLLANNFLKPLIENCAKKKGYRFPQIPEKRMFWFSFVFMIVPGLSYTMKNYILALSGICPRNYFLIGLIVNGIMGIPLIVAGNAAVDHSFFPLTIIFVPLLVIWGLSLWIREKYYQSYFESFN